MLSLMIDASRRGEESAYDVATIYALLGRKEDAFQWLDRAVREHEEYVIGMGQDPFLASLRTDPRFGALLRSIGLPA